MKIWLTSAVVVIAVFGIGLLLEAGHFLWPIVFVGVGFYLIGLVSQYLFGRAPRPNSARESTRP
jgi:hypothetical protein